MPRWVSFFVLLALVLLIGGLFYRVIASFLLPLFLALVLTVLFRPLHRWTAVKCRGRERIAAVLVTLAVLFIVLVPVSTVLTFAGVEAMSVVADLGRQPLGPRIDKLRARLGLQLPPALSPLDSAIADLDEAAHGKEAMAAAMKDARDKTAALRTELRLVAGRESPPADVLLASRLAELDGSLQSLAERDSQHAAFPESVAALQANYATQLRPLLAERFLGSRLKSFVVLQANPTQRHLAELRQQVLSSLGADSLGPLALSTGQYVGGFLVKLIIGLVVTMISLYYFLADGPVMTKSLMAVSPLDNRYIDQMLTEFDTVSRAVVSATFLSALVQGLLAGIGYYFAGLDATMLLTVLTMIFALVPFVGATTVWLPCCLWLFLFEERTGAAVALAVYCVLVVANIDNLIKPLILHGQSNLHPLLALLSVLGGVTALGPVGIFVGPMAVAFLQAGLNMLRSELSRLGDEAPKAQPQRK